MITAMTARRAVCAWNRTPLLRWAPRAARGLPRSAAGPQCTVRGS